MGKKEAPHSAHGGHKYTGHHSKGGKEISCGEENIDELAALVFEAIKDDLTTPELRVWCSDRTLKRYIRARKYKLDDAIAMIKASIVWRKDKRPEHIRFEDVMDEARSGKMYVCFDMMDRKGRPCLVMRPRNQNTADHDAQIRYFVYVMERASYLADGVGVDKMAWTLDFPGYSVKNAPPMKTSMETLRTLQDHYPERLGEAICYRPPWIFMAFWKTIRPFVDPVTTQKVCMVSEADSDKLMAERFDLDLLEQPLGGRNPRSYDLQVWAKAMVDLEERLWAEILQEAERSGQPVKPPPGRGLNVTVRSAALGKIASSSALAEGVERTADGTASVSMVGPAYASKEEEDKVLLEGLQKQMERLGAHETPYHSASEGETPAAGLTPVLSSPRQHGRH